MRARYSVRYRSTCLCISQSDATLQTTGSLSRPSVERIISPNRHSHLRIRLCVYPHKTCPASGRRLGRRLFFPHIFFLPPNVAPNSVVQTESTCIGTYTWHIPALLFFFFFCCQLRLELPSGSHAERKCRCNRRGIISAEGVRTVVV